MGRFWGEVTMLGLAGAVLALGLLIFLAYRGFNILLLAPLAALVAVAAAGAPLLASYTQVFLPAMGGFLIQFFPLFLLGAVFGKLMEESGAARSLADAIVARAGRANTIPAIVLACAVLTYGGVSLFVVAFAVYPIAASLFARASLPRELIPAAIALGAFTFTMTALPGTPAIQNAIPMPYFGTTAFAAPGIGVIASAIMLGLGFVWLRRRAARWRARPQALASADLDVAIAQAPDARATSAAPPVWIALVPIVAVLGFNYLLSAHLLPALDTSYLSEARFGAVGFAQVKGIWSISVALIAAILLLIALNWRRLNDAKRTLDEGAAAAMAPAFNTASLVGFGAVVASLPAFALVRDAALSIAPDNPLISLAIAVNLLAGVTGSASGGMSIALETLGEDYLHLARAAGVHPDLLHRVTAVATGGLDSLPHNGAVVTLLGVCKLSHREAYKDIFVVACLIPIAALAAILVIAHYAGSF